MASAIIGGMLDNGYQAGNIWVSAPDDAHLQTIRKRFGVSVTTDNRYCAQQADMVVLAVKPQVMADVCRDSAGRSEYPPSHGIHCRRPDS